MENRIAIEKSECVSLFTLAQPSKRNGICYINQILITLQEFILINTSEKRTRTEAKQFPLDLTRNVSHLRPKIINDYSVIKANYRGIVTRFPRASRTNRRRRKPRERNGKERKRRKSDGKRRKGSSDGVSGCTRAKETRNSTGAICIH